MTSLGSRPFVLLDDQSGGGRALLYSGAAEIVATRDPAQVRECLERLDGRHAAGFLSYEAGHALEPKLAPLIRPPGEDEPPLLWFGLFEAPREVDVAALLPDAAGAWAAAPRPCVTRGDYAQAVARVLAHIGAGDIYQANLTFACDVPFAGHPLALYAALRARSRAPYGAILFTGAHWILSLSPELFLETDGNRIVARPMKGTAPRSANPKSLSTDPKQRAENLMIVDLLRNDISRVSRPGTVAVPSLFEVETYPTLHQMTSTVTAELEPGAAAPSRLLAALFPCGSITGAPKIRAQQILAGLERGPRGVYTGAIGRVAPDGEALFNVAIRTLVVPEGGSVARLGLGSGIVADSLAADEWRECLAKGAFVTDPARSFDLVETMRFEPDAGMPDLERHLARLKRSADALGFAFDRHHARNELQAATFRLRAPARVRLLLSPTGALAIEIGALPPAPAEPVAVALAPRPVNACDFRLAHKTSDRAFWTTARDAEAFETVVHDEAGFVTEGSFTSLFVECGGKLLTPPLSRGLLPGILRQRLIEEGRAEEADLVAADLVSGFLIGNAMRGLIRAALI